MCLRACLLAYVCVCVCVCACVVGEVSHGAFACVCEDALPGRVPRVSVVLFCRGMFRSSLDRLFCVVVLVLAFIACVAVAPLGYKENPVHVHSRESPAAVQVILGKGAKVTSPAAVATPPERPPKLNGWREDDYVNTKHYPTRGINASTVEGYALIRTIRRAVRRTVSKYPTLFNPEVPHVSDLMKRVDDVEELEKKADLVAQHMKDPFPSKLAGDDPRSGEDLSKLSPKEQRLREAREQDAFDSLLRARDHVRDYQEFAGGRMEARGLKEVARRKSVEERVKSKAYREIDREEEARSKKEILEDM